jgi:cobyrinic acid a,c-diamide synthase
MAFTMRRGAGIDGKHDGLVYKNVLATYTHLHALGAPQWAEALVRRARMFHRDRAEEK